MGGILLAVAAIPLALYGLFAIAYTGDTRNGDTYVKMFGSEVDADVAGLGAVAAAVLLLAAAVALVRRP